MMAYDLLLDSNLAKLQKKQQQSGVPRFHNSLPPAD